MEELTSGDPGDGSGAPAVASPRTAGGSGPPVTLDPTDDSFAPRPGPGVAAAPDGPVLSAARSGVPATPPRIRFTTFVVQDADRVLGAAYLLTGSRERAEELL